MTQYNKPIFVKDYFDIHNHYKNIYGNSTLILMQVGSFHEAYNTDIEGPDLYTLGERINYVVTQKNKSKPLSTSNPRMMGFPSYIVDDMIDKIVGMNYTVIRIDQTTEPPNPKREIVGVFSPSTNMSTTSNKNTNLVCIVFDGLKLKTPNPLLCIGMTAYDMMTGSGATYQTVSTNIDMMLSLDNTVRFLEKYPPCETIYHFTPQLIHYMDNNNGINRMRKDDIISYLGIQNELTTYSLTNIEMISNVKYQEEILEDIFKSQLEDIGMHTYMYARFSLVGLLHFTANHQPILLSKLKEPIYFDNDMSLYIGNRGLEQLNIFPTNDNNKSLFNILGKYKTPMGRRYLMSMLCNPLICPKTITDRYNVIELLLRDNNFEKINSELHNIIDIPKVYRKLELNKINPNELVLFYNTFLQIMKVIRIIRNIEDTSVRKVMKSYLNIDKELYEKVKELVSYMSDMFDLEYIEKLSFNNYTEETKNYINDNNSITIELAKKIDTSNNFMDMLVEKLEGYIEEKNNKVISATSSNGIINMKFNERDGHYMLVTKRRCKILRDKLKESIMVGSIEIKVKDLEFSDLPKSNNTKITCKQMNTMSDDIVMLKQELAKEMMASFYKIMEKIVINYGEVINTCSNTIMYLDFLNCGASCAYKYGYTKPEVQPLIKSAVQPEVKPENDKSYFTATELRHPIVEAISTDVPYHPHDIELGLNKNGILLYGLNSAGKSTLIKSIGIAIIMAQIGYYVPASKFVYYPYKNLFTRIVGNDNLYKGMSSFMVEMMELMAILKRNSFDTMVIADELCRGTEEKSANIIVAYMLETLNNNNCSFVTATHLHAISELPTISNMMNVKIMHIKVSYDEKNDMIVYDRVLSEGQGDKYYGVMVAKYMMRSDDFNNRTKELEMEYENYKIKKSNYNKDLLMLCCEICKSKNNLETHHILPQKDCDDVKGKTKIHIKKNSVANLVILCSKCHDKHDRGDIDIKGWIDTTDGRKLVLN